ncbi:MAG TPA: hypothetical protein P5121_33905 [Caldilineaceae bacterium]|nr:hypothetical protein [Caldilineaceae bacterium]
MNSKTTAATEAVADVASSDTPPPPITLDIYITQHCGNCAYAQEVAADIRQCYPQVRVRLIDLQRTTEPIPDAVFATPTYLLNGRVWSLGNPSPTQVQETLATLCLH